jgi:2-phosphosulfolactate phosphatase
VAVDVMRATTTAVTIARSGRRCFPVPTLDAAFDVAHSLPHPLLVGELHGRLPEGFHLQNSPATLESFDDLARPAVLLSSSGTRLLHEAQAADAVYAGALRNLSAQVAQLVARHPKVAVIGAGTKGEFRREDQFGCARIAGALLDAGYEATTATTAEIVARWRTAPVEACAGGRSAEYLRRTGQVADLAFILSHIDDVDGVFRLRDGELVAGSW